ncbi:MAG TPA: transporter substrate-binding domain-containing protein [Candidatus Nitrosotalea sp.]|jgi:polar amino acid transport system substrate-binding protein|nr:transporter substrate-binding domain-containing protein [Candidatus Nitrosotalea sp.]
MQRRTFLRAITAIALALSWAGLGTWRKTSAAETVKLGIGDWPPYFGQDLKHGGCFAYIVSQAFAAAGYQVAYSVMPWKRALAEAEEGSLDGSPGWKATDERRAHFLFSDAVITSTSVFFYRKEAPFSWMTMADLAGKRIGVTAGYSYGVVFDAAVADKQLTVDAAKDDATALKMLVMRRVDLVVMNRDVGLDILHRRLDPDVAALIDYDRKPIDSQPSYLAIAKSSPRADTLIADFNRGLAKLRSDGALEQVQRDLEAGLFY